MIIEDSELQIKKQATINGTVCTLSYHPRLKTWFVCRDTSVIHIDSMSYLASSAYDKLIKQCLNQPCTVINIVEGSLVEA